MVTTNDRQKPRRTDFFGFKPVAILPGLVSNDTEDRMIDRLDTLDTIRYAKTVVKERFDSKHQPLALRVGDSAYIRLHRGYQAASKVHHKFGPQRTGPFKVTGVLPNHAGPGVVLTNDEQVLNSIGVAGSHVGSDFEPRGYDP